VTLHQHDSGRLQERGADGRFEKPTAAACGFGVCPKCQQPTAHPPIPETRPVDPAIYNARVCAHCGWDSRRPT
jgi:hypothetical protein